MMGAGAGAGAGARAPRAGIDWKFSDEATFFDKNKCPSLDLSLLNRLGDYYHLNLSDQDRKSPKAICDKAYDRFFHFTDIGSEMEGDVKKCLDSKYDPDRQDYARHVSAQFDTEIPAEFYDNPRQLCEAINVIESTLPSDIPLYEEDIKNFSPAVQAWARGLPMYTTEPKPAAPVGGYRGAGAGAGARAPMVE